MNIYIQVRLPVNFNFPEEKMNLNKINVKKVIRALFISGCIFTYLIALYIHIGYFRNGESSIVTTLLFYITLFLAFVLIGYILSLFIRFIKLRRKEFFLFFITLFSLLFLVELFLKYEIKTYQGYPEKNGGSFFRSFYRQINLQNRLYKSGSREEKVWYWWHMPNAWWMDAKPEFSYRYSINSAGARDREFALAKAPGEYRIIILGDSYTEGVGTAQDSTYPRFLEKDLMEYYRNRKISVYNCGASGSDPFYEYILFRDKLLQYSPDLVIIGINSSDIQDVNVRDGIERFKADGTVQYRKPPVWEPLYCLSYIFRHIIHDLCGYNWMYVKYNDVNDVNMRSMMEIEHAVSLLDDLSRKHNFRLLVVVHPTKFEIKEKYFPMEKLPGLLRKDRDVEVLNLFDCFINEEKMNRSNYLTFFWEIDGHNTAKGYEFFAKGVSKKIIELDWINQQPDKR